NHVTRYNVTKGAAFADELPPRAGRIVPDILPDPVNQSPHVGIPRLFVGAAARRRASVIACDAWMQEARDLPARPEQAWPRAGQQQPAAVGKTRFRLARKRAALDSP